jgi:hypothetical protein
MDDVAAIAATAPGDPPPAIVSGTLVSTIKHMMASDPADRLALTHLAVLPPMARTYAAMEAGRDGSGGRGRGPVRAIWRAAPALVDEPSGWLEYVLDE